MTVSAREAALAALFDLLGAVLANRSPPPTLLRNETISQRIPPGGLVVLLDGETLDAVPMLGLGQVWMEHQAMVEIHASGATEPVRRLLLDALLQAIAGAIIANPTLTSTAPGAITISIMADPVWKPWESTLHAT